MTLAGGEKFSVSFGNAKKPGVVIESGKLKQLIVGVTSDFSIGGVKFKSDSLTFGYLPDSSKYMLYGGPAAMTLAGGEKFSVSFGKETKPGVVIESGKLRQLILGLTSDFSIGGVNIESKNLTIEYIPDSSRYALYGGPAGFTLAGGEKFSVSFSNDSNPGLLIEEGKLKQLIAGVTSDFSIGGVKFASRNLTFKYQPDSSVYALYGGPAGFNLANGDSLYISFGDEKLPGLLVEKGALRQMICTIATDFKLGGATLEAKNLTFGYLPKPKSFYVYGGPAEFKIGEEAFSVKLGINADSAGLKIINGKLKDITLTVDGDLRLASLTFKPEALSFSYLADANEYKMWGGAKFDMSGESLDLKLGTDIKDPGLLIQKGKLMQIKFGVTSDLNIGGLKVTSKNAGFAYLSRYDTAKTAYGKPRNPYNKPVFALFGDVGIKTFFSAEVSSGTIENPGIYIINDKSGHRFDIDTLYGALGDINLGVYGIKKASIAYSKKYINIDGAFDIAKRFSFESRFDLVKEKVGSEKDTAYNLKQIVFDWHAIKNRGIPIGETDVFLNGIKGNITNIDLLRTNPSSLTITADVDLSFGGHCYDANKKKAFEPVHITGNATISGSSITLNSDEYIIAFAPEENDALGSWKAYLAKSSGSAIIDWTHDNYSVSGEMDFTPSDPCVVIKGNLGLNGQTIGYLGDVDLRVPHEIPFIGGKSFGSVDGAMLIRMDRPDKNLVAGWVTITIKIKYLFKKKLEYGIRLKFPMDFDHPEPPGSFKFGLIGSSEIKDIKKEVGSKVYVPGSSQQISSESLKNIVHSFSLADDQNAAYCLGRINFNTLVDLSKVKIIIKGPSGEINTTLLVPDTVEAGYTAIPPGSVLNRQDSSVMFMFGHSLDFTPDSDWAENAENAPAPPVLLPGLYEISTYYPASVNNDIDLDAVFKPSEPLVKISASKISDSTVQVDAILWNGISTADSTEFNIYASDSSDYKGRIVSSLEIDNQEMKDKIYKKTFIVRMDPTAPGKSNYFYASMHDSTTGLVFSDISQPVQLKPDIYGFVRDSASGRPVGNIILYMDNNGNGTQDGGEVVAQTDSATGAYYFPYEKGTKGFAPGRKTIRISEGNNIEGYSLKVTADSPNPNPAVIDFTGQPTEVNFIIKEEKK